ncbi:MAG: substrate-binding domain-containing protein [Thermodesulfobacteriota bacterium]
MKTGLLIFARLFFAACLLMVPGLLTAAQDSPDLLMATTTSTDNTGLLEYLEPHFENKTGIDLRWTATGTGKALELAKNCDVDVLLVHAPEAEKQFVENGYGKNRTEIMYNDFVIIGPESDPAGVGGKAVPMALTLIKDKKEEFVSRGDDSGTHKKELSLWQEADPDVPDKQPFYIQTGQGMLPSIRIAEERSAYTITDRGTYIKYAHEKNGNPGLEILVEGGGLLRNQYSVIRVSRENCPDAKAEAAGKFSEWMAGKQAQELIGDFKLLGKTLFTPNSGK